LAVHAAPLLLFAFPALVALEPAAASPLVLFSGLLLLLAMVTAYAMRTGDGTVYLTAAMATILTETIWSMRFLDSGHLLAALKESCSCVWLCRSWPPRVSSCWRRRFRKGTTGTCDPPRRRSRGSRCS
jgi:hypothetical protein